MKGEQRGKNIGGKLDIPAAFFGCKTATKRHGKAQQQKSCIAALYVRLTSSHVPHKFTKMQSGPMTNVISPNSINIRIL
jgi:hypothetical protein